MKRRSDWYPSRMADQIEMANIWVEAFAENGARWRIQEETVKEFSDMVAEATRLYNLAQDKKTRTTVITADFKAAMTRMRAGMRDIKKRYLHIPPLNEGEIAWLRLRLRDATLTPSRTPTAQAKIETFLTGRHELGTLIVFAVGDSADPVNDSYRVYYTVQESGDPPPEHYSLLKESFSTRRKKGRMTFDPGDSGKTCYFAVQIENGNKKGPWGPITSALIP